MEGEGDLHIHVDIFLHEFVYLCKRFVWNNILAFVVNSEQVLGKMTLVESSLKPSCRIKDMYCAMNQLVELVKQLDTMQMYLTKCQQLFQLFLKKSLQKNSIYVCSYKEKWK